jgi:hypothetical protein
MWQTKLDTPDILATYDAQYEDKQSKNITQYVFDTTMCKQIIFMFSIALKNYNDETVLFRSSCMCTRGRCTHKLYICVLQETISSVFNNVYISAPKLDHHMLGEKDAYVKFVSASTPCTHA